MSFNAFFSFCLISMAISQAQPRLELPDATMQSDSTALESAPDSMPALSPPDSRYRQDFEAAQSMVTIGHVLAGGGFIIRWIGNLSASGPLILGGHIAYAAGVPVSGVGAGRVNRAAAELNSGYEPEYRGWGWYWTGLVMDLIGTGFLVEGISSINNAEADEKRKDAESQIVSGVLFSVAGGILGIVAWVKFARLAGEGSRAGENHSLRLTPYLHLASDGKAAPGLALNLKF